VPSPCNTERFVLQLPPQVQRSAAPSSDFTYVVEVRRGNEYRASQIEHVEQAESDADRQIQAVYAAVSRLLPPGLLLKP